jgi:hypothetical protein
MNRNSIWRPDLRRRFNGIVAACSVLFFTSTSFAAEQEPKADVRVTGSSPIIAQNAVKARSDAVDQAMVEAALSAASELLTTEIFAQNKDVLNELFSAKPKSWIQDYKVLNENRSDPKKIEVVLSVVPNRKRLREELSRMGILFDRSKRPTLVMYFLTEPIPGKKGASVTSGSKSWTRRVASRLQRLGYNVDVVETIRPDQPRYWDIVVDGVISQFRNRAISFELHGVHMKTKTDLGRVQARFNLDDRLDLIAGMGAIRLLGQVLPEWFRQTGEGRTFSVTVVGLKSYAAYKDLKDFFNSGASGFTSARESMISQGVVSFDVMYDGEMAGLMKAMRSLKIKTASFNVTESGDRAIRLEAK